MNIIFCGTPDFSTVPMKALIAGNDTVVAVFTQPDRKSGRGKKITASPVKQLAVEHNIELHQPSSLRNDEMAQIIANYQPDLMVVVAYGLIIPQKILDIPTHGCWNIHASLLPRWRGAAPIQRAILAGDKITGVGIMHMEAGLDTGPVYLQKTTPIENEDNSSSLHNRLAQLGANALVECIEKLHNGTLPKPQQQDENEACYAHKLDKAESTVDWTQHAKQIERQIRAFDPWPGSSTEIQDLPVKIWQAKVIQSKPNPSPGRIAYADAKTLQIQCGTGLLDVREIQTPGKKRLPIAQFMQSRADWYGDNKT